MISSTAGFIYSGNDTKKVNGFKFTNVGNGWQVWVEDLENYMIFRYLPNEINEDFDFLDSSYSFKIVNEGWNEEGVERLELIFQYGNKLAEVTEEVDCNEYTLILKGSNNILSINEEEKCFYLDGDYVKIIEGITYKLFGIV